MRQHNQACSMLFLQAFYLAGLLLDEVNATCYFPDGDISPADVACDPKASDSFCCYSKQACLSNKLCITGVVDGIEQYARGTCTDSTWQSGACPRFCLDQQALGNAVFSCNVTGSDSYCCNEGCSCGAGSGDEAVSFTGTPYTITVIGAPGTYPNPSATATSLLSSFPTSSAESTAASLSSSPASSTASLDSSSSSASNTALAATGTPSPSTSPSPSKKSNTNDVAIGAGVGVGVGVGIILLAAAAFFFYRRRPRPRSGKEHGEPRDQKGESNPEMASELNPESQGYYSELGGAGHGYSELGTERDKSRPRLGQSSRQANVPELPGH